MNNLTLIPCYMLEFSICKGHFLWGRYTHTLHGSSFFLTLRLKPTLKYLHYKNQS